MRRFRSPFLPLALLLLAAVPAAASGQTPAGPLAELNQAALDAYRHGRQARIERASPIIVVAFDDLVFIRDGRRERVTYTPALYHHLKSTAHLALGIHGAAGPWAGGPLDPGARDQLGRLRQAARNVEGALDGLALPPDRIDRQRRLLAAGIGQIDRLLARGTVDAAELIAYGRAMAPLLLANADDAARVQLDGLHAAVEPWRASLSDAEWRRLIVVVLGAKTPRPGNVQLEYFAYAMGRETIDRRLIYAEGLFDVEAGLRLVGTLLSDRAAGQDVFGEEGRLERDFMADGAQAHLLRLFGRLGRD
jgi:hypothetical protein